MSRQAIEQRLTPEAAETLKTILETAVAEVIATDDPQTLPLLETFNGVYVQDSTWIALPDELHAIWQGPACKTEKNKASLKLQLRFDVLSGAFEHFQLTDGLTADSKAEKQFEPLPAGSLRLADLGYFSLDAFEELTQTGVFWLTRLKVNCKLFDEQGEPFCLQKHLKATKADTIDLNCFVGAKKRLGTRLVALRCSKQEANKRRRHIRQDAKRRGKTPSKQRLQLAGWNIYITNIDATHLTPQQVATIARVRWQVELMFKCFKSIGKVNTSRSNKPYRILCEVYAKLLVVLIQHWGMLAIGWQCLRHSLLKTAKLITSYARALTASFFTGKVSDLIKTFTSIKRAFQNGCFVEGSAMKMTTFKQLQEAKKNP